METPEELLHQLGAFEVTEAKRIIAVLEAQQITFEVEADHSALANPTRPAQFYLGMYPDGSKLAIFVPESQLAKAMAAVRTLFPV